MDNIEQAAQQRSQELDHRIRLALQGIRYGSVEIIIHDSKIVQIERKEKVRIVDHVLT